MSKKQSGANLPSPPERLVFFLDRSLGRNIVSAALRQAGEVAYIHDDLFPQNAPDTVWLTEAGNKGWIVLTKDTRIRYRAIETAALRAAKVRAFVVTAKGDLRGQEIADIFIKALPPIRKLCAKALPPFIARVSREGKVSLIQ
jgi:hypothetical protein